MRCGWSINIYDIITSLSDHIPFILSFKKRFIKFIRKCSSCQNDIVTIPMLSFVTQFLTHNYKCTLINDSENLIV